MLRPALGRLERLAEEKVRMGTTFAWEAFASVVGQVEISAVVTDGFTFPIFCHTRLVRREAHRQLSMVSYSFSRYGMHTPGVAK